jgi:hypothetical protein
MKPSESISIFGESVFNEACVVRSMRVFASVSPHTNTFRESNPSSKVTAAGSTFSERMGGSGGDLTSGDLLEEETLPARASKAAAAKKRTNPS